MSVWKSCSSQPIFTCMLACIQMVINVWKTCVVCWHKELNEGWKFLIIQFLHFELPWWTQCWSVVWFETLFGVAFDSISFLVDCSAIAVMGWACVFWFCTNLREKNFLYLGWVVLTHLEAFFQWDILIGVQYFIAFFWAIGSAVLQGS